MSVYHDELTIQTKREGEIIDLTDEVEKLVHLSHIQDGLACIFVPGSTGAVTTMEYEPGLLKDIPRALERLAPKNMPYDHHETWHDDNGRSHVRQASLGQASRSQFMTVTSSMARGNNSYLSSLTPNQELENLSFTLSENDCFFTNCCDGPVLWCTDFPLAFPRQDTPVR